MRLLVLGSYVEVEPVHIVVARLGNELAQTLHSVGELETD